MEIKNKELLLKIADHLETIPDERFDLGIFTAVRENICGTVGCIFGHAVIAGLIPGCKYESVQLRGGIYLDFCDSEVQYPDEFGAIYRIFGNGSSEDGMTDIDESKLYGGDYSRKNCIRVIRRFVETNGEMND